MREAYTLKSSFLNSHKMILVSKNISLISQTWRILMAKRRALKSQQTWLMSLKLSKLALKLLTVRQIVNQVLVVENVASDLKEWLQIRPQQQLIARLIPLIHITQLLLWINLQTYCSRQLSRKVRCRNLRFWIQKLPTKFKIKRIFVMKILHQMNHQLFLK